MLLRAELVIFFGETCQRAKQSLKRFEQARRDVEAWAKEVIQPELERRPICWFEG